jgi:hypothetical protein
VPRQLEREPLLWIGVRRFPRGHSEEVGVELVDAFDETPMIGTEEPVAVAVPDCVDAPTQQAPDLFGPRYAWRPRRDPHDRDLLPIRTRHGIPPSLMQFLPVLIRQYASTKALRKCVPKNP